MLTFFLSSFLYCSSHIQVVITIYSRNALHDNSKVLLNSVSLQGHVTHSLGDQLFNFDWPLWGVGLGFYRLALQVE